MVQFGLELPKHVFTETPVSPSISRVFKGFPRVFRFTKIWAMIIVIIGEKWTESIAIIKVG